MMIMSMATETAMARARTKSSEKLTVPKVTETSTVAVIVTAKTMSKIITTEVAMEWDVTLWIRMVNKLL